MERLQEHDGQELRTAPGAQRSRERLLHCKDGPPCMGMHYMPLPSLTFPGALANLERALRVTLRWDVRPDEGGLRQGIGSGCETQTRLKRVHAPSSAARVHRADRQPLGPFELDGP